MRNWASCEPVSVIATGRSQPSTATAASAAAGTHATRSFRRASRHDSLCMKVMVLGGYGLRGGTDNPPCGERARRRYRPPLWSAKDDATSRTRTASTMASFHITSGARGGHQNVEAASEDPEVVSLAARRT